MFQKKRKKKTKRKAVDSAENNEPGAKRQKLDNKIPQSKNPFSVKSNNNPSNTNKVLQTYKQNSKTNKISNPPNIRKDPPMKKPGNHPKKKAAPGSETADAAEGGKKKRRSKKKGGKSGTTIVPSSKLAKIFQKTSVKPITDDR